MEQNQEKLLFTITPGLQTRQERREDWLETIEDPAYQIALANGGVKCQIQLLLSDKDSSIDNMVDSYKSCGEYIARSIVTMQPTPLQLAHALDGFNAMMGVLLEDLNGDHIACQKQLFVFMLCQPVKSLLPEVICRHLMPTHQGLLENRQAKIEYREQAAVWLTLSNLFDMRQSTPTLQIIDQLGRVMNEPFIELNFKIKLFKLLLTSIGFLDTAKMAVLCSDRLDWFLQRLEDHEADETRQLAAAGVTMILMFQRNTSNLDHRLLNHMKSRTMWNQDIRNVFKYFNEFDHSEVRQIGEEDIKITSLPMRFLVELLDSELGHLFPGLLEHSDKLRSILKLKSLEDIKKEQVAKSILSDSEKWISSLFGR